MSNFAPRGLQRETSSTLPPAGRASRTGPIVALLAGPLALFLFVACFLAIEMTRSIEHDVYLVNGLTEPYAVVVNGRRLVLEPNKELKQVVGEERLHVSVEGAPLTIAEETHNLHVGMMERWMGGKVFVLNPDRLAVLEEETISYSRTPQFSDFVPSVYHYNKSIHEFSAVDFLFEPRVEEINVLAPGAVRKRRVGLVEGDEPSDRLYVLPSMAMGSDGESIEFAMHILEAYPEDRGILNYLSWNMESEAFRDLMVPYLVRRPVDLDAHEVYQTFAQSQLEGYDVAGEYRRLHEGEPDDKLLAYLYASVEKDYGISNRLLLEAASEPGPVPQAQAEVARRLISRCQFVEALAYIEPAYRSDPENEAFMQIYQETCRALGNHAEVLRLAEEVIRKDPSDSGYLANELVRALVQAGHEDRVEAAIDEVFRLQSAEEYGKEYAHRRRQWLRLEAMYSKGEMEEYLREYAKDSEVDWDYEYHVMKGDAEKAFKVIEDYSEEAGDYLVVYILATHMGKETIAKDALRRAIEDYATYSGPYEPIAGLFRGSAPPSIEEVRSIQIWPNEKRIIWTALGLHYPGMRDEAFEWAVRCNYSLDFPHHLIAEVAGNGTNAGTEPAAVDK